MEPLSTNKDSWSTLTADSQFHRCLLILSFDILRTIFNMTTVTFQEVLSALDVNLLDLYVITEIVLSYLPWLPKCAQKRIKEIQERLLESEVWADAKLYGLLSSKSSEDLCSESMKIFREIVIRKRFTSDHLSPASEYKAVFILSVNKLSLLRLNDLCTKIGVPVSVANRAFLTL
ncbi:hypothetical protein HDU67_003802 [Dinochytrium kinnereticum]|nr:hypothetical protein HDU67_003802 [Dinochytrium kinnereticum]